MVRFQITLVCRDLKLATIIRRMMNEMNPRLKRLENSATTAAVKRKRIREINK